MGDDDTNGKAHDAENGSAAGGDAATAEHQRRVRLKTTLGTQADALLRKNVTYQKRNWGTNCCLVSMPVVMCLMLKALELLVNSVLGGAEYSCGCICLPPYARNATDCPVSSQQCGIEFSSPRQMAFCPITNPVMWPAFVQVPTSYNRAVNSGPSSSSSSSSSSSNADLPPPSCRSATTANQSCPTVILITGANQTQAQAMGSLLVSDMGGMELGDASSSSSSNSSSSSDTPFGSMFGSNALMGGGNSSERINGTVTFPSYIYDFAQIELGTNASHALSLQVEPAFTPVGDDAAPSSLYLLQQSCDGVPATITIATAMAPTNVTCVSTKSLWRADVSAVNSELYNGFYQAQTALYGGSAVSNEYTAAFDFANSRRGLLNATVYYNATFAGTEGNQGPKTALRFPRLMNMATNAYLRSLYSPLLDLPLLFLKDFPKPNTKLSLDFASLIGPLFFMWILLLLFPVFLGSLVYEKERRLRMMMKMHGLGDGAYWIISYSYFFMLSLVYVLFFVCFGSVIDLKFFRVNSYSLQAVFYFVFFNWQIALAVLVSTLFKHTKTASVVAYLYVFGGGLLGQFLLGYFLEDSDFPSSALLAIELVPPFALFRGLYELSQSAFIGNYQATSGTLTWSTAGSLGFSSTIAIMAGQWALFILGGAYLDQVLSSGSGARKHPLFFLDGLWGRKLHGRSTLGASKSHRASTAGGQVDAEREREDVTAERALVQSLLQSSSSPSSSPYAIVCDNMRKAYPGRDGNPPKLAVRGASLAIGRGECFGMLGPNGAGKTTCINMMIGLVKPSSGTALVGGKDILDDMDAIYSDMGVCPQHDLLWDQLTGREHLLFYGRLKNLKGGGLLSAVEDSLKQLNLFAGGVADKQSGRYSGGMKRRLSVAISLIGKPPVVYMDEPSTGLDPASRNNLWSVVKEAKKECAIVLTTHSMEEAEALCDRLGIFVNGQFECIGNPRQLTARYGGSYVFTITTPVEEEEAAVELANSFSAQAKRVYRLAGTQKFELPSADVNMAAVFSAVANAKSRMSIRAWGIANTKLEDVFISIAKEAQGTTAALS